MNKNARWNSEILVTEFKRCDFPTCGAPRPGWPKTMKAREIIVQIHELTLEDRRISAKSIAHQKVIWIERVWSIIHEDLDMRKLSAKWVSKSLNSYQKHLSKFGIFSTLFKWFPVTIGDHGWNLFMLLWPRDKATVNGVAA
jgi:hypothetical protein